VPEKPVLLIWIRIGHPGSVLGMQIDNNLQTKLVSCLSKRLLYVPFRYFFTLLSRIFFMHKFNFLKDLTRSGSALKPMRIRNNGKKQNSSKNRNFLDGCDVVGCD
jgi:hypothetical protein